jgi:hypothetical protein
VPSCVATILSLSNMVALCFNVLKHCYLVWEIGKNYSACSSGTRGS